MIETRSVFRKATAAVLALAFGGLLLAAQAQAALTVTPITWDVVGLDHNRPLTSGPDLFPVAARVCSDTATTNVNVSMVWGNTDDQYIVNRPGSLTTIEFAPILANECVDAYFEIQVLRAADAFDKFRPYTITATDSSGSASTPAGRQIYIERLVSQNRNTTLTVRYGQESDKSDWVPLGAGGTLNVAVGETYFVEYNSETATSYEQLQSFLHLQNTVFLIKSVETTYSVVSFNAPTRVSPPPYPPNPPHPQLWADACLWDSSPISPNYNSCLDTGKAGGSVRTVYEIEIISGGGDSVKLQSLIYDRSGSSFHYNSDFTRTVGTTQVIDPTDAGFAKRFIPSTIGAGGVSTLRFTITNPNPVAVSGYNFVDNLPSGMVVADTPNASSTCGGTVTAVAGQDSVSFADGALAASSSCTILVSVTVPFDQNVTYPLELVNTSENLFVGADDTGKVAQATLTVSTDPPPACIPLSPDQEVARWTTFPNGGTALAPIPTSQAIAGIASALAGPGLDATVNSGEWRFTNQVANQTLEDAIANNSYFEFRLQTTNVDSVNFAMEIWRQNVNAPATITLFYGPPGNLVESIEFSVPNQNNRPNALNFSVPLSDDLNPSGDTVFRLYAYGGGGINQPLRVADARFQASGDICAPPVGPDPPTPPSIEKSFAPNPVDVGAPSTLTFTLNNPNAVVLTGVTFRDEFPSGMTAVTNTFVNTGCGGVWGLEDSDLTIVLLTGASLAAQGSCTLSVAVVSTTLGDNLNISDPINAFETFPGNSAIDTLGVRPPPTVPAIQKFFDPNPLLSPNGSSTLTFRITNTDQDRAISSVAFVDPLPLVGGVQMVPVDPFGFTTNNQCGAAPPLAFVWNSVDSTLSLTGGAIPAGQVCEIRTDIRVPGVDVTEGEVLFPNETGPVSHVFNGILYEGNTAEATLVVDEPIPGISILKEVGLTTDPNGAWLSNIVVSPGTNLYYKITIENTGEVPLSPVTVADPDVSLAGCTWTNPLPVASMVGDHIDFCIVGPVSALQGTYPNTATVTGTYNGTDYTAQSTATYTGQQPTAVIMGNVDLAYLGTSDFLVGLGALDWDAAALLNLLTAWDPDSAAALQGASREAILAALREYLDPDGDGHVAVFRWETLEERGTIGFYAERLESGAWWRINAEMLPGLIAAPMGAEYWLADPSAGPGTTHEYRLIEIEARGTTREYGPFAVRAGGE